MNNKVLFFLVILLAAIFTFSSAAPAQANWYVNSLGWLVYEADNNVLGDQDEIKTEERKVEEKKEEKREEKREEERKEVKSEKQEVEYFDAARNAWIKAKTENGKSKVEVKTLDGREMKLETERERQKYKLQLESEAGVLKLEAETEDGERTELGEDDEIEIEPDEDDDKIRVATGSGDGEMIISRNRVRAKTNFPLSVDLNTNELIVTTPAGVKRVTVLPDQAIANLLEKNVLDRVDLPVAETGSELNLVETEDGTPAYEIAGESDQEFLGFLPVKIKSKIKVSAETGEVLASEKPLVTRLLDLLSF